MISQVFLNKTIEHSDVHKLGMRPIMYLRPVAVPHGELHCKCMGHSSFCITEMSIYFAGWKFNYVYWRNIHSQAQFVRTSPGHNSFRPHSHQVPAPAFAGLCAENTSYGKLMIWMPIRLMLISRELEKTAKNFCQAFSIILRHLWKGLTISGWIWWGFHKAQILSPPPESRAIVPAAVASPARRWSSGVGCRGGGNFLEADPIVQDFLYQFCIISHACDPCQGVIIFLKKFCHCPWHFKEPRYNKKTRAPGYSAILSFKKRKG